MARKDRIYIPTGTGGLLRYSEEGKEYLRIKPEHVILICILIAILEIVLSLIV